MYDYDHLMRTRAMSYDSRTHHKVSVPARSFVTADGEKVRIKRRQRVALKPGAMTDQQLTFKRCYEATVKLPGKRTSKMGKNYFQKCKKEVKRLGGIRKASPSQLTTRLTAGKTTFRGVASK